MRRLRFHVRQEELVWLWRARSGRVQLITVSGGEATRPAGTNLTRQLLLRVGSALMVTSYV